MGPIAAVIRIVSKRIERDDLVATFKFLGIVTVLPLLPNEGLDTLFGVNPRHVWLVVAFVAGLSFLGYLLSKVVDPKRAIWLSGVVGGCLSSSLAIVSLSEQARRYPEFAAVYTVAAATASTILFPRLFVVVGIVSPSLARSLAVPFVAMTGVGAIVTVLLWHRVRTDDLPPIELDTPFRVRPALAFGALVAVVMAALDTFDPAIPSAAARSGVVLIVAGKSVKNVGIAWVAGASRMARAVAALSLCSTALGTALVFLP
ncbi:DUF4010 domain-containing protein [Salinilacihabitans rarus]|uniref:DUF4010 domain-containing protein n=1 Tax=Salinilacihabitans rarus TaxID=2961596 RepID=UPI0020C888BC|nr:DUF4010 domain-containing protein [Salinilacihabitans rarus]